LSKEPSELFKLTKPDTISDFFDEWSVNLALMVGQNRSPQTDVIQEKVDIPDEDDDPAFGILEKFLQHFVQDDCTR
jgi:hypothetical protein